MLDECIQRISLVGGWNDIGMELTAAKPKLRLAHEGKFWMLDVEVSYVVIKRGAIRGLTIHGNIIYLVQKFLTEATMLT